MLCNYVYIHNMYLRKSSSKRNGKEYTTAQIVEGYRTEDGKTRQNILLNLGPVDKLLDKDVDNLINGLLRLKGQTLPESDDAILSSRSFGQIWAILMVWKELKISQTIRKAARKSKIEFDLVAHIQAMVINRLDDPQSKLGLLSWLEEVYLPKIDRDSITYPHLLRSMDFLIKHKESIEKEIAQRFLTIFDSELKLCFYDITSSYFEGDHSTEDDIRKRGYSRDHRNDRRQVVIGVVMNQDGIPLAHYTFDGNTSDRSTVIDVVADIKKRYGVKNVILVADKGMTSTMNYGWLKQSGVQFILGESKRIRRDARAGIEDAEAARLSRPESEQDTPFIFETSGEVTASVEAGDKNRSEKLPVRRIYSYNPATAKKQSLSRGKSLDKLFDLSDKLKGSSKKPAESYHQLRDYAKRHGLSRLTVIPSDPTTEDVSLIEPCLQLEEKSDGWFVISTNTKESDGFTAEEVERQYKRLQLVERGFRTLKGTLDIRPMYHWTSERIKSHIFICFIALQINILFNLRLKGMKMTFEKAVAKLRTIHVVDWQSGKRKNRALTSAKADQLEIFKTLKVPHPTTKSFVVSDF